MSTVLADTYVSVTAEWADLLAGAQEAAQQAGSVLDDALTAAGASGGQNAADAASTALGQMQLPLDQLQGSLVDAVQSGAVTAGDALTAQLTAAGAEGGGGAGAAAAEALNALTVNPEGITAGLAAAGADGAAQAADSITADLSGAASSAGAEMSGTLGSALSDVGSQAASDLSTGIEQGAAAGAESGSSTLAAVFGAAGEKASEAFGEGFSGVASKVAGGVGLAELFTAGLTEEENFQAVTAQTAVRLQDMGDQAGVTAAHVRQLAEEVSSYSGTNVNAVQSAENFVLTLGHVRNAAGEGNDVFDRTIRTSQDLAVALGVDLGTAAQRLGRLLDDPVQNINVLNRAGIRFSQDQQATIKTLVQTGDLLGAQKIILDEVSQRVGNSAHAYGETLPGELAKTKVAFEETARSVVGVFTPALVPAAQGLQHLFEDARPYIEQGAALLHTAISTLARDFGPLGPALHDIGDALTTVWHDAEPVAAALAGLAFGALEEGARLAGDAVRVLAGFVDDVGHFADEHTGAMLAFGAALAALAAPAVLSAVGDLAGVITLKLGYAISRAAGAAETAGKGIAAALGAAGPAGLAAAGLGIVIGAVALGMESAASRAKDMQAQGAALVADLTKPIDINSFQTFASWRQAYEVAQASITRQLNDVVTPSLQHSIDVMNAAKAVADRGAVVGTFQGAQELSDAKDAYNELKGARDALAASIAQHRSDYDQESAGLDEVALASGISKDDIIRLAEAHKINLADALTHGQKNIADFIIQIEGLSQATAEANNPVTEVSAAIDTMGSTASKTSDKISALSTVLDEFIGTPNAAREAAVGFDKALQSLITTSTHAGHTSDDMTSSLDSAETALVRQADATYKLELKTHDQATAARAAAGVLAEGKTRIDAYAAAHGYAAGQIATVNAELNSAVAELHAVNGAAQLPQASIDALAAKFHSLSGEAQTLLGSLVNIANGNWVAGIAGAVGSLGSLHLPSWVHGLGLATGGPVIGGSWTHDDVPVLAEGGEWMLNQSDVTSLGGFGGVQRMLADLHGQAGGGAGGNLPAAVRQPAGHDGAAMLGELQALRREVSALRRDIAPQPQQTGAAVAVANARFTSMGALSQRTRPAPA